MTVFENKSISDSSEDEDFSYDIVKKMTLVHSQLSAITSSNIFLFRIEGIAFFHEFF